MSTDSADSESASPRASLSPASESEGSEGSLLMDLDALLAGEDLPPTVDSPPWEPSYRIFKNFDSVLCSATDDENSLSSEEWELPDPEENFTRLSLKRMASFSDEEDCSVPPKFPDWPECALYRMHCALCIFYRRRILSWNCGLLLRLMQLKRSEWRRSNDSRSQSHQKRNSVAGVKTEVVDYLFPAKRVRKSTCKKDL